MIKLWFSCSARVMTNTTIPTGTSCSSRVCLSPGRINTFNATKYHFKESPTSGSASPRCATARTTLLQSRHPHNMLITVLNALTDLSSRSLHIRLHFYLDVLYHHAGVDTGICGGAKR
jgi:hypothetical protein